MKLYHGTSLRKAARIMDVGLEPRRSKSGNWQHTMPSRTDCVYMTVAYAMYFALNACKVHSEHPVVFEIDTLQLNPFSLLPDEDYLEQATRRVEGKAHIDLPPEEIKGMAARTRWFRERLHNYNDYWENSIIGLGNCCFQGVIPPKAITRFAVVESEHQAEFCWQAMDPTITILNYQIVGAKYRGMTKWLFGDDLGDDAPQNRGMFKSWEIPKHRKGIQIIDTSTFESIRPRLERAARRR